MPLKPKELEKLSQIQSEQQLLDKVNALIDRLNALPSSLAAPGTIGGTTPAAGTFTTVTISTLLALAAGADITAAAGATDVDLSASTGFLKTPSGAHTFNGDVTLAQGKKVNLGDLTVAQLTNIDTDVTINGASGVITTQAASVAAGGAHTGFTVNNSAVLAGSVVHAQVITYSGALLTNGIPVAFVDTLAAGSFRVRVMNLHATNALNGTMKIHFTVL